MILLLCNVFLNKFHENKFVIRFAKSLKNKDEVIKKKYRKNKLLYFLLLI